MVAIGPRRHRPAAIDRFESAGSDPFAVDVVAFATSRSLVGLNHGQTDACTSAASARSDHFGEWGICVALGQTRWNLTKTGTDVTFAGLPPTASARELASSGSPQMRARREAPRAWEEPRLDGAKPRTPTPIPPATHSEDRFRAIVTLATARRRIVEVRCRVAALPRCRVVASWRR